MKKRRKRGVGDDGEKAKKQCIIIILGHKGRKRRRGNQSIDKRGEKESTGT